MEEEELFQNFGPYVMWECARCARYDHTSNALSAKRFIGQQVRLWPMETCVLTLEAPIPQSTLQKSFGSEAEMGWTVCITAQKRRHGHVPKVGMRSS